MKGKEWKNNEDIGLRTSLCLVLLFVFFYKRVKIYIFYSHRSTNKTSLFSILTLQGTIGEEDEHSKSNILLPILTKTREDNADTCCLTLRVVPYM